MAALAQCCSSTDDRFDPNIKLIRVRRGLFSMVPRSFRLAFGGHTEGSVMYALLYRSNITGPCFSMPLGELRELTEDADSERVLSDVLKKFKTDGYFKRLECPKGNWRGFQITLDLEKIQDALDNLGSRANSRNRSTSKGCGDSTSNSTNNKSSASRKTNTPSSPPTPSSPIESREPEAGKTPSGEGSDAPSSVDVPVQPTEPVRPTETPGENPPEKAKPKVYAFPMIPRRMFPHDARAEIRYQFHARFGFELPIADLDFIESHLASRGRTLDELYALIARHWAVSTPDNPVGFAKWFATNRMGVERRQMSLKFTEPVDTARCSKCKWGYVSRDPDVFCDCGLGRDLAAVQARSGVKA